MEKKKKDFLHKPVYAGGPKAMSTFIYKHLRYPSEAAAANIEGVVLVEYDIDNKGLVTDTRVLKGLGYGCDEEACRVVRMLKFEVEKNRGLRVIFHQKAHIKFKKPAPAPVEKPAAPQPVQAVYHYAVVTPKPPAEEAPKPPSQVYQYTIKL